MDSRLKQLVPDEMSEEQAALYWRVLSGPRSLQGTDKLLGPDGSLPPPLNAFLFAPGLGSHLESLGAELRFDAILSEAARELVVLQTAAFWRCGFEWAAHEPEARRAGLSDEVIHQVLRRLQPVLPTAELVAVYTAVNRLLEERELPPDDYDRLKSVYGEGGAFEVFALVGYYSLLAFVISGFQLGPPLGGLG